ncbi:hypothetical protein Taro_019627 [Colocasia esculenta]|uniref:Cupin type-1 domain-containing protein n=1 Tax=Colocasia esculenta TaxID=4460 RepID=A0A843UZS7_COLES|nr:hypothetical protein [Colocasia esculenta]
MAAIPSSDHPSLSSAYLDPVRLQPLRRSGANPWQEEEGGSIGKGVRGGEGPGKKRPEQGKEGPYVGATMGDRWGTLLLVLLVAASWAVAGAARHVSRDEADVTEELRRRHANGSGRRGLFLLDKSKQVVKTEAGEVRVVKGFGWRGWPAPMHVGFISMEPNSLFIPQYMDASLILFVKRGESRVGWIHDDKLVERQLKVGDIYRIPAGSTFYIANTGKRQKLQFICSIDTSESLGDSMFQASGLLWISFFIGGGLNPTSVLSGFVMETLSTAFNVSSDVLSSMMKQSRGPIVYTKGDAGEQAKKLASLLQSKQETGQTEEAEVKKTWSWRKLLDLIMWADDEEDGDDRRNEEPVAAPEPYNLYGRSADFSNDFGWSIALDEGDYAPLKHSGLGVYLVNLTAGAMMAPHLNPTAAEYGVVLRGSGRVQVVFPNGSTAMDAEVTEGDVFWVPRYFPFCQIASRKGSMQFFGFTTSARKNRPQFLVGASSILRTMMGPEMAAAFGTSEDRFRKVAEAQTQSTILPPWPRDVERRGKKGSRSGEEVPLPRRATA